MVIEIVSFFPLKMGMFHSYVSHNQRVILGVFMDPMWIHEIPMNTRLGQHDADLLCVEEHHSPHLQPAPFISPCASSTRRSPRGNIWKRPSSTRWDPRATFKSRQNTGWICWCRWCFDDGDLWWRFDDDFYGDVSMMIICLLMVTVFLWWCLVMKLMKHVVWCRHLRSWVDDCFGGLDSRFVHEDHREWSSINWNPFLWRAFEHCSLCERF